MKKTISLLLTAIVLCTSCFAALAHNTGDVNEDNIISIIDIAKSRSHIVGNLSFSTEEIDAGDVNSDGKLDVVDVMLMRLSVTSKNGEVYGQVVENNVEKSEGVNPFTKATTEEAYKEDTEVTEVPEAPYVREYYYRESLKDEASKAIYDTIDAGIKNVEEKIKFDATTTENASDIYRFVLMDHPEYFYLTTEYSCLVNGEGKAVGVVPGYKADFRTTEQIKKGYEYIDSQLNPVIEEAKKLSTTFDKVVYVYDFVKGRYTYQYGETSYDIYGALTTGESVCEGYSETFAYILEKLQIKNILADGVSKKDSIGHRWNMVNLEGKWYHFDATWDDNDTVGTMDYNYFGLTTEEISASRTIDYAVPTADATDYNFLSRKGLVFDNADVTEIANATKEISAEYNNSIALKFENRADFVKANTDASFIKGLIREYVGNVGFGYAAMGIEDVNVVVIQWKVA